MIQRMALAAFMLVLMASALAQDAKPDSTKLRWDDQRLSYKLEFVLKQMDKGKVVSTHKYLMSALSHVGNAEIRTGNRVPVDLGGDKGINYIDIGLQPRCNRHDCAANHAGTRHPLGAEYGAGRRFPGQADSAS